MEIRIENNISIMEIEKLKELLDEFFETNFDVSMEKIYVFFRKNKGD